VRLSRRLKQSQGKRRALNGNNARAVWKMQRYTHWNIEWLLSLALDLQRQVIDQSESPRAVKKPLGITRKAYIR
jgi:hypothetical protein